MSYTIFKKKLFVKTKDQRIMGFVYSADSSITRGVVGRSEYGDSPYAFSDNGAVGGGSQR